MNEATQTYPADRRRAPALRVKDCLWDAMGQAAQALPAQVTARLTRLSRVESVDLPTVMLAAWGLLLDAGRAGPDIGFNYQVCSRPPMADAGSPDANLIVGPHAIRLRVASDQRLHAWLKEVQRHQAAGESRSPMTLAGLRPGTGTRGDSPLSDSLVLIHGVEPCPVPTSMGWHTSPHADTRDSFPLTLTVHLGEYLGLVLRYRHTDYSAAAAESLLGRLGRVLTGFARGGMQRLGSIAAQAAHDEWERASPAAGALMPDYKPMRPGPGAGPLSS
ncbi:MAG TPA: condensation domain-containing protein [Burkholderiaceae bacterium]|nr:condensation domain-containing protein [Burkholderiaceae bacterium]